MKLAAALLALMIQPAMAQIVQFSGAAHGGGGSAPVVNAASFTASSTNAPAAQSGQAIGAATASNLPTGWSIASCSPSCGTYFSISSAGAITVASAGASAIAPSFNGTAYTLTVTASNGAGTSSPANVPVTFYNDGALSAPIGTTQLPTQFSSYGRRPSWKVAGVDYYVGLPAGTTLQDPATATLPSGCSYSSARMRCTTAGITVSGFDFSLHSAQLEVSANNINVENNKFAYTAQPANPPITIDSGAVGTYIAFNTINESGFEDVGAFGGVIYSNGGGSMTIEYNYILNGGADLVDSMGGTTLLRYNLMTYTGEAAGAHPDFNQYASATNTTPQVYYNTWINAEPPSVIGSQGTYFGDNNSPISGGAIFSNNSVFAIGSTIGAFNYVFTVVAAEMQSGATVDVENNYADITKADGFFYSGGSECSISGVTCANNINLVTGGALN